MKVLHIKFLLSDRGWKILEDNGMKEEELIEELRYMAKDHVLALVDSADDNVKEEVEKYLLESEKEKNTVKEL